MYIKIENSGFKVLPTNSNLEPIKVDTSAISTTSSTLFETIKIENKKVANLNYHQKRVDLAFKNLFKTKPNFTLKDALKNHPTDNLYRAKIVYNKDGLQSCSYYIYSKKIIKTIALVEITDFNYNYKYTNRELFLHLQNSMPQFDEFLITQNGYLKDTTIANIALLDSSTNFWHTPEVALLDGTTKERYINDNKLIKKMIHFRNLKNYTTIATLNAMVGFNILR